MKSLIVFFRDQHHIVKNFQNFGGIVCMPDCKTTTYQTILEPWNFLYKKWQFWDFLLFLGISAYLKLGTMFTLHPT